MYLCCRTTTVFYYQVVNAAIKKIRQPIVGLPDKPQVWFVFMVVVLSQFFPLLGGCPGLRKPPQYAATSGGL